jgi:hypothetical protein
MAILSVLMQKLAQINAPNQKFIFNWRQIGIRLIHNLAGGCRGKYRILAIYSNICLKACRLVYR